VASVLWVGIAGGQRIAWRSENSIGSERQRHHLEKGSEAARLIFYHTAAASWWPQAAAAYQQYMVYGVTINESSMAKAAAAVAKSIWRSMKGERGMNKRMAKAAAWQHQRSAIESINGSLGNQR